MQEVATSQPTSSSIGGNFVEPLLKALEAHQRIQVYKLCVQVFVGLLFLSVLIWGIRIIRTDHQCGFRTMVISDSGRS
jgi:hypothetical protein